MTSVEEALRRRLGALPPASRARLLRLLNLPGAEPATLIGALYPDSEFLSLREFLIDLEDDLPTLAAVVSELRRMERNDYLHSLGSGTMGRVHAHSVGPQPRADDISVRPAFLRAGSRGGPMAKKKQGKKGKKDKKGKSTKGPGKKTEATTSKAKSRSKKLVKQAKRGSKKLLRDAGERAKKVGPKVRDLVHHTS